MIIYPDKPWEDKQTFTHTTQEGEEITGIYNAPTNTWSFYKGTSDVVFTNTVYTVDIKPAADAVANAAALFNDALPLPDTDSLVTQQDVNWYLYDLISSLEGSSAVWIGNDTPPNDSAGVPLFKFWWKEDESELYVWDEIAIEWRLTGLMDFDRPPIVQATPPTSHPKFEGKPLEEGDFWIDSNKIMHYWTGSEWQEVLDSEHYQDDYVKKTGDTMTGALIMDNAENIVMENTDLIFNRSAPGSDIGDVDNRFSTINSTPPINLDTGTLDYNSAFGIEVSIDAGNTFKNRFKVNNRNGDIVTISGGTGPQVGFGSGFEGNQNPQSGDPHWEAGEEGGIRVSGIPTPTKENPDSSLAANKNYVDIQTEILQNEIIELEEEIDAIAPSVERGKWRFTAVGTVANAGQFTMYDDAFGSGQPTGLFKSAKSIWFNAVDTDGVTHAFGDVDDGELLEIFVEGSPEYGLYEVVGQAHDETQGATSFWVIDVNFVRTNEDTSAVAPGETCRFKVFMAPTGGNAGSFVLKSGDTMTGTLQLGKVTTDTPNSTPSPRIKFEGKTSTGSTNNAELYYLGSSNYLYTNNNFYASGTVQSHSYGGFGYAGDTRMGFGSKTVDGVSSTKYGYLGIGSSSNTRAMEWSGSKGLQWLKADGSAGSQGQVLKKSRASGSNESRPKWQGVVDISTSTSNRSVGELWYNSSDQVLYLKVS